MNMFCKTGATHEEIRVDPCKRVEAKFKKQKAKKLVTPNDEAS